MSLHEYPSIIQGQPEWHDVRRGLVTASSVGKLITVSAPGAGDYGCPTCAASVEDPCISLTRKATTPIKGFHDARVAIAAERAGEASPILEVADNETSRGLVATLVAERIAGWTESTPMTFDMYRGVDSEPYARDVYSEHHGTAREIGFMRRDEPGWTLGYSPDGLVDDDGLIEIKAPRAKTHITTILTNQVPAFYMPQLQAGLLVSGREWIDFVSYVGGMPLYTKRVYPDPVWHDVITKACIAFEQASNQMVAAYAIATKTLPPTERIDLDSLGLVF